MQIPSNWGGGGGGDLIKMGWKGGRGPSYMGLAATTWVFMGARDLYCHHMMTQTHPKAPGRLLEKCNIRKRSNATEQPKNCMSA